MRTEKQTEPDIPQSVSQEKVLHVMTTPTDN